MDATKSRSVHSRELRDIDEWCADATLRSSPPEVTVKRLVDEDRALVGDRRRAKAAAPASSATTTDALAVGVTSIAEIEKLMEELLAARDYLQSEGERVRQVNARYTHLAKTASASAKIIAESLGEWCNLETAGKAAVPLPQAPTLTPLYGDEHESNDQ
jgi:hypothetical protein